MTAITAPTTEHLAHAPGAPNDGYRRRSTSTPARYAAPHHEAAPCNMVPTIRS